MTDHNFSVVVPPLSMALCIVPGVDWTASGWLSSPSNDGPACYDEICSVCWAEWLKTSSS